MWKLKLLKNRPARASVQSVAATSAAVPVSQVASLDNSQAASAAIADLTTALDFVFDFLHDDDDVGDVLRSHLEKLAEQASLYRYSSLEMDMGVLWNVSHPLLQFVEAACHCAAMVYSSNQSFRTDGLRLEPVLHMAPSKTGTVKACSMWKVDGVPLDGMREGNTLIVSIRGTASKMDHTVNANGEVKDASSLFNFDSLPSPTAHAGFLSCAKSLLFLLRRDIAKHLALDPSITHVLFTGHSAGGAVASLLFLHFLSLGRHHLPPNIPLSLITFGSPPSVSPTPNLTSHPGVAVHLALVNEYDLVPRADKPYLRSIIDLYRSRFGLHPLSSSLSSSTSVSRGSEVGTTVANLAIRAAVGARLGSAAAAVTWPLPERALGLVGEVVVLGLVLRAEENGEGVGLRAVKVDQEEFGRLVFCDLGVHRRIVYMERVKMLVSAARGGKTLEVGRGRREA